MIRFRRRGIALLGTAVLTAASVGVVPATPATAAPRTLAAQGTPFGQAQFAAYGTGSEVHVGAVANGGSTLVQVDQAVSANHVDTGGVGGVLTSPITTSVVQSDQSATGALAYARGSGAEAGVGLSAAQENQIQLALAEAHSPPPSGLVSKTAIPVNLAPIAQALLVNGNAATAYGQFCPVGQPIAYGEGDASANTAVVTGTPPVVSAAGAAGTQTAQTRTRTDLVANADGTFGILNQVQETIAPLTVNLGAIQLAVTVQGADANNPLTITTANDGEGHATTTYLNDDPVLTVTLSVAGIGVPLPTLVAVKASTLAGLINPLLGSGGLINTALSPFGITLAVDVALKGALANPKALPGFVSTTYDLLHVLAKVGNLTVADVRLGHAESMVVLPGGPITCNIPVAKVSSAPTVQAGSSFTWTISIPSTAAAFAASTCDLVNIKATDKITVNSGSPTFTITSISNNGVATTAAGVTTITWANLGSYHPGDPPIAVTINISIPAGSPAGVLQDTANVTAGLGNCSGGASGQATLVGTNINNVVLGGTVTLIAPAVTAVGAGLATTGTGPMLPWIAVALLVMAEATRRMVRKARHNP